jgi:hypothetical protein
MILYSIGYVPYNSSNPSNYINRGGLSATNPITYNNTTGAIGWTNSNNYITLSSLSGTAPIGYNNSTGAISINDTGYVPTTRVHNIWGAKTFYTPPVIKNLSLVKDTSKLLLVTDGSGNISKEHSTYISNTTNLWQIIDGTTIYPINRVPPYGTNVGSFLITNDNTTIPDTAGFHFGLIKYQLPNAGQFYQMSIQKLLSYIPTLWSRNTTTHTLTTQTSNDTAEANIKTPSLKLTGGVIEHDTLVINQTSYYLTQKDYSVLDSVNDPIVFPTVYLPVNPVNNQVFEIIFSGVANSQFIDAQGKTINYNNGTFATSFQYVGGLMSKQFKWIARAKYWLEIQ